MENTNYFLGIDTSNYTTSAAIADENGNIVKSCKKLLPVKEGEVGVRQSDAVFHHVRQLPEVIGNLYEDIDGNIAGKIKAIGYSARPRDVEGSYMPCFNVGASQAAVLSKTLDIPKYDFSHQAGHIAAAVYGSGAEELRGKEFYAFHVSGGTTEALYVSCDGKIEIIGGTLDLNAGQLIDRIGVKLGLAFPCGSSLEKLAIDGKAPSKPITSVKDCYTNLSGMENKATQLIMQKASPNDVAAYTIDAVKYTLAKITEQIFDKYGKLPLLYAGGVMSCTIIKNYFSKRYGAFFAPSEFSSDNAAGIAILCSEKYRNEYIF